MGGRVIQRPTPSAQAQRYIQLYGHSCGWARANGHSMARPPVASGARVGKHHDLVALLALGPQQAQDGAQLGVHLPLHSRCTRAQGTGSDDYLNRDRSKTGFQHRNVDRI